MLKTLLILLETCFVLPFSIKFFIGGQVKSFHLNFTREC